MPFEYRSHPNPLLVTLFGPWANVPGSGVAPQMRGKGRRVLPVGRNPWRLAELSEKGAEGADMREVRAGWVGWMGSDDALKREGAA